MRHNYSDKCNLLHTRESTTVPGRPPGNSEVTAESRPESLGGASFRLRGLFFPILGRCIRFERTKKARRDTGYVIDRRQKRDFVGLRRFVETGDLPHELQRRRANLFVSRRRIEVKKGF